MESVLDKLIDFGFYRFKSSDREVVFLRNNFFVSYMSDGGYFEYRNDEMPIKLQGKKVNTFDEIIEDYLWFLNMYLDMNKMRKDEAERKISKLEEELKYVEAKSVHL